MRRTLILLCLLALLLALAGCGKADDGSSYTIGEYTVTYTDELGNGTITDGTNSYAFRFSGNSGGYSVEITYPDGSSYHWTENGNFGHGGWSEDYDENRYVRGDDLVDVLAAKAPKEKSDKNVLLIFLLLIVGAFNTAAPRAAWYLESGWRFKDAEPSDLALGLNRVVGVAALLIALIMIIV